jgi:hypothetical protein
MTGRPWDDVVGIGVVVESGIITPGEAVGIVTTVANVCGTGRSEEGESGIDVVVAIDVYVSVTKDTPGVATELAGIAASLQDALEVAVIRGNFREIEVVVKDEVLEVAVIRGYFRETEVVVKVAEVIEGVELAVSVEFMFISFLGTVVGTAVAVVFITRAIYRTL